MKNIYSIFMLFIVYQYANSQDSCNEPTFITTAGFYVVESINGEAPILICAENGKNTNDIPAGEWFSYTPTQDYTVTITTNISQNIPLIDTRFHVYTDTCFSVTCYAGDDDSGTNNSSIATFNVDAGITYIIAFDNKWDSSGFTFQLIEAPIIVVERPINYTIQNVPTQTSLFKTCVVDMNGDYKDDIVGVQDGINGQNNSLKVHYQVTNSSSFTITNFPILGISLLPSWSIAAGDYNKDGYNDLILGGGGGLSVWKSNSTATSYSSITPGQYIFCQRTNFADLNNDGNLDVFSCHDIAPNVYYLNDATGNLTYYQSSVTPGAMNFGNSGGNYSTLWTDFDNDGDTDVFVSKCSGPPCELYRNDGLGIYTDISAIAQINVPVQSWSSAIADYDNDGDMDIIITASSGTHKYFRNNLDTTNALEEAYTNITVGSGWDTNTSLNIENVAYDFDNNGYIDVLGGGNKIMFNQGNSTFNPISYPNIGVGAIGDLNDDGFLDILNGNNILYAVPNGNKWIKMNLKGIQSNSNGIGARVEIYGAFGKQIRDIRSGEGFGYMSSLNAHFGIGSATAVTQVVIKWPSGIVDTINNPAINQSLLVVEGSSLAIEDFTNSSFSLSPNPATNVLNIKSVDEIVMKSAQVYDLNGKLILQTELTDPSINVESLNTGTYILLLRDSNGKDYSQKFLKE